MTGKEAVQRSSGGRILLFASLAINLFLLGLLVGGWTQGLRILRPDVVGPIIDMPMNPEFNVRRLAQSLPEDTRKKLQTVMRAVAPDFREARRDAVDARRGIYEALKADPFEQNQLDTAFATVRAADDKLRQISHGVFFEFASQLDQRERAFLVESLEDIVRERAMQNRGFNRRRNGAPRGQFRDRMRPPGPPGEFAPDRPPTNGP